MDSPENELWNRIFCAGGLLGKCSWDLTFEGSRTAQDGRGRSWTVMLQRYHSQSCKAVLNWGKGNLAFLPHSWRDIIYRLPWGKGEWLWAGNPLKPRTNPGRDSAMNPQQLTLPLAGGRYLPWTCRGHLGHDSWHPLWSTIDTVGSFWFTV